MTVFVYGPHGADMLIERNLDQEWVERTVQAPDTTEPDPDHAKRIRAFRSIPERDSRMLRVVYELQGDVDKDRYCIFRPQPEASKMKAKYDSQTDALYVRFADAPVVETEEVRPGIMFDFDADGRIVAIEVLDATENLTAGSDLKRLLAA